MFSTIERVCLSKLIQVIVIPCHRTIIKCSLCRSFTISPTVDVYVFLHTNRGERETRTQLKTLTRHSLRCGRGGHTEECCQLWTDRELWTYCQEGRCSHTQCSLSLLVSSFCELIPCKLSETQCASSGSVILTACGITQWDYSNCVTPPPFVCGIPSSRQVIVSIWLSL